MQLNRQGWGAFLHLWYHGRGSMQAEAKEMQEISHHITNTEKKVFFLFVIYKSWDKKEYLSPLLRY